MPIQIGVLAHDFLDPTGLLSDCHRRIEMFLGSLAAIATQLERPLDRETRRALDSALGYFREAAPKHVADEEDSLFPRLRQISDPELQSALSRLEALEDDHRWATALHARVEVLGKACLHQGRLSSTEAEEFGKAVSDLQGMYKEHIEVEDSIVFPVAARALSPKERIAIAEEMAARRKIELVAQTSSGLSPTNK